MITAHISNQSITSNTQDAFSLYEKSRFGEKKTSTIEYNLFEALFLVSQNKMQVIKNKVSLSMQELHKIAKKHDKRFDTKFACFENLRKKGYIVKTALKFGADFRVYEKGIKPGQDHAAWLVFPVKENEAQSWYDFAAKNRVAVSTKKKLLIAIVDDESDVTYYEVNWMRP